MPNHEKSLNFCHDLVAVGVVPAGSLAALVFTAGGKSGKRNTGREQAGRSPDIPIFSHIWHGLSGDKNDDGNDGGFNLPSFLRFAGIFSPFPRPDLLPP